MMIAKTATAAFALACTLGGTALAAPPAATPHMTLEHMAPGHGAPGHMATGRAARAPGSNPAVTETAGQIRASRVLNTHVLEKNGQWVATITDLIVDRHRGAVTLAVLKPDGGAAYKGGRIAVAWTSLKFQPTPTPRFLTALSRKALSAATPFKSFAGQARHITTYYDVKTNLLGKNAVGPHGHGVGQINDLVFNLGSGRLVALIIRTGGLIDIGANDHAIAWGKAEPSGKNPVHLALSKAQVDSAPVASMTPLPTPAHEKGAVPFVIHRDQTGNLSGTSIPGPATRR